MATKADKPVTRESCAFVRDKGSRAIMITVHGAVIQLRAKGLRTVETIHIGALYEQAVRARVRTTQLERRKARRKGR